VAVHPHQEPGTDRGLVAQEVLDRDPGGEAARARLVALGLERRVRLVPVVE